MLLDSNQRFINFEINELNGKINKIYLYDKDKVNELKNRLKEIVKKYYKKFTKISVKKSIKNFSFFLYDDIILIE